jgi:hypothetical protein
MRGAEREPFFARAVATDGLTVIGLLGGDEQRLGYGYTTSEGDVRTLCLRRVRCERVTLRKPSRGSRGILVAGDVRGDEP